MRDRGGAALDANDDVVRKPDDQRLIGGFERSGLERPAGRRLGGNHPPAQLAHRLLDQLERLFDRALHRQRAQVGIGLHLLVGEALARIGARIGPLGRFASAANCGGDARSVVTSLMCGRL